MSTLIWDSKERLAAFHYLVQRWASTGLSGSALEVFCSFFQFLSQKKSHFFVMHSQTYGPAHEILNRKQKNSWAQTSRRAKQELLDAGIIKKLEKRDNRGNDLYSLEPFIEYSNRFKARMEELQLVGAESEEESPDDESDEYDRDYEVN